VKRNLVMRPCDNYVQHKGNSIPHLSPFTIYHSPVYSNPTSASTV